MTNATENNAYRLTQYARGAGCGCKIAPQVLDEILKGQMSGSYPDLLVGNQSHDDAAVYQLNEEEALISTTDFFTPVVDDPYMFGKVAAANALSDVYAMGGTPLMALAVLGWPVEKLPAALANRVMEGARELCTEAGIPLAGGHSIDAPEPFFGLSVNGRVRPAHLKRNNTAREGDLVLLTKPLGVGLLTTAAKRGQLRAEDEAALYAQLTRLNRIGERLGPVNGVHAMTDVTGFGLAGHLLEMAEGSGLSAELSYSRLPRVESLACYLERQTIPDATFRNWKAMHEKIQLGAGVDAMEAFQLLPDPQTNGGMLLAVAPEALNEVQEILTANGYAAFTAPIGRFTAMQGKGLLVNA